MITNKQMENALELFREPNGRATVPGLNKSEHLVKVARCWESQYGEKADQPYDDWVDRFLIPFVIRGIEHIRHVESWRREPGVAMEFSAEVLIQFRGQDLAAFESSIVEAFQRLRDAARLLGLPRNYFISRENTESERHVWKLDLTDYASEIFQSKGMPYSRPPIIEPCPDNLLEICRARNLKDQIFPPYFQNTNRESLALVADIWDCYESDLQYMAKRGKKTFETWAIRKIWGEISDLFNHIDGELDLVDPWVTIKELLALCNVSVDPEMVRKTINAQR